MIEVEQVVAWSATERSAEPKCATGEVHIVARDSARAIRFYTRVFGLRPVRGASDERLVVIPVTPDTKLVIHEAHTPIRFRARCARRWGFVVADLDVVRAQVWELGVKVARDSGAPDHIYRWSSSRSLYVKTPDGHEIELVELNSEARESFSGRTAEAS